MLPAAVTGGVGITDIEVLIGMLIAGAIGWRWKRGDFYKAVASEKTAEAEKYAAELVRLRQATDITPILKSQERITQALERHTEALNGTLEKVADMNGSLRATTTAMTALADKLILDEAARGLLAEAAKPKTRRSTT